MPRVPVYERRVGTESVRFNTPTVPVVSDAVGMRAMNEAGQVIRNIAKSAGDIASIFEMRHNREKERQVLEVDTKFRKEVQSLLHSTEAGEDGRPAGLLNRRLTQAAGVTQEFDETFSGIREKYLAELPEEDQRIKFGQFMDSHYMATREGLIRHEAAEDRSAYENTYKANLGQRLADAGTAGDLPTLLRHIKTTTDEQATALTYMGYSPEAIAAEKAKTQGAMAEAGIMSMMQVDPVKAAAVFDELKDAIPADAREKLQKAVDDKRTEMAQVAAWDKVKGMRLIDGTPDEAAMLAYVQGLPDVKQDVKDGIWKYVNAKAGEQRQQIKAMTAAEDKKFIDDIQKSRTRGASVADVLKLAKGDERKENVIRRMFGEPVPADPAAYAGLLRQVNGGVPDKDAIYRAFVVDKTITPDQYQRLMGRAISVEVNGMDEKSLSTWREIERMSSGLSASQQDEFLGVISDEIAGKKPDEALKIAQDHIKNMPKHWWNTALSVVTSPVSTVPIVGGRARSMIMDRFGRKVYQEEAALLRNMSKEIGADVLSALGSDPSSVTSFAESLGVSMSALNTGTPVNNAIKSLSKRGERATAANVKAVLSKYPDGNY